MFELEFLDISKEKNNLFVNNNIVKISMKM